MIRKDFHNNTILLDNKYLDLPLFKDDPYVPINPSKHKNNDNLYYFLFGIVGIIIIGGTFYLFCKTTKCFDRKNDVNKGINLIHKNEQSRIKEDKVTYLTFNWEEGKNINSVPKVHISKTFIEKDNFNFLNLNDPNNRLMNPSRASTSSYFDDQFDDNWKHRLEPDLYHPINGELCKNKIWDLKEETFDQNSVLLSHEILHNYSNYSSEEELTRYNDSK